MWHNHFKLSFCYTNKLLTIKIFYQLIMGFVIYNTVVSASTHVVGREIQNFLYFLIFPSILKEIKTNIKYVAGVMKNYYLVSGDSV